MTGPGANWWLGVMVCDQRRLAHLLIRVSAGVLLVSDLLID